jgi:hypothetical protein
MMPGGRGFRVPGFDGVYHFLVIPGHLIQILDGFIAFFDFFHRKGIESPVNILKEPVFSFPEENRVKRIIRQGQFFYGRLPDRGFHVFDLCLQFVDQGLEFFVIPQGGIQGIMKDRFLQNLAEKDDFF